MSKATSAPGTTVPETRKQARTTADTEQQPKNDKLTRHWRGIFLDHLADTSNVTSAATEAGIHPSRAYKVRRLEPEFAALWRAALCEGYDNLELDVLFRLRHGEPKDGPKYDNANALRLLALHRDTVSQERAIRDNVDAASARASIDAKLEDMRQQVIARRASHAEADCHSNE